MQQVLRGLALALLKAVRRPLGHDQSGADAGCPRGQHTQL